KNYPILNEPGKGRYAIYFRLNERAVPQIRPAPAAATVGAYGEGSPSVVADRRGAFGHQLYDSVSFFPHRGSLDGVSS
ncbi:hypothetical protein, partial [Paramuribaculum intestinale]|uniref:hypothetical protein n=1 Tax=Paramuribaculum intestinale TaxID=2094151 RepID=UPI0025B6EE04